MTAINLVVGNVPARYSFANYHYNPNPHASLEAASRRSTQGADSSYIASSDSESSKSSAKPLAPEPCSDERRAANDARVATKTVSDAISVSQSDRNVADLMGAANRLAIAEVAIGRCIGNAHFSDVIGDAVLADDLRALRD